MLTLARCSSDEATETAEAYLDALGGVDGFTVEGGSLILEGPDIELRYAR